MVAEVVVPSVELRQGFLAMLDDFDTNDPHNTEFYAPAKLDFPAYVKSLLDEERGINLRDGWVPCTHRWLVTADGIVVGVSRLRHNIATPFLAQDGGHIGYDVSPSHRRRGYGHLALATAMVEAKRIGIPSVLLITGEDSVASRAVIERKGGLLESIAFSEFWGENICRYWIEVTSLTADSAGR
jgi:predicted acetyltransferase